jgi:hypothetical protein
MEWDLHTMIKSNAKPAKQDFWLWWWCWWW